MRCPGTRASFDGWALPCPVFCCSALDCLGGPGGRPDAPGMWEYRLGVYGGQFMAVSIYMLCSVFSRAQLPSATLS